MATIHRDKVGANWNEGARLSWLAMRRLKLTQADLDRALKDRTGSAGDKSGYSNRVLYGDRLPGRKIASLFNEILGVPLTAWDEPAKEPFSAELTGRAA